MQRLFLFVFLVGALAHHLAAQLGNEWIDYGKTYYKFEINEDGIYRIPFGALTNAGLGNISGSQFRLYHLGQEVAIYTTTDGGFVPGDFIEFYGQRNRGEFDRTLYLNPDAQQLNPAYSMFTDYAPYFLTWDNNGTGKRIVNVVNDITNPPAAETYYMHRDEWIYSDKSIDPRNATAETPISLSRFQEAEGFATAEMSAFQLSIASPFLVSHGPDAELNVRLASSSLTPHNIIGMLNGDTVLSDATIAFRVYTISKVRSAGEIAGDLQLNITDHGTNGLFSLATIHWTYPRQYDFTGRNTGHFRHTSTSAQHFALQGFVHSAADPVVYDLQAGVRLLAARDGGEVRFVLPAHNGEREIVIASQADAIRLIDKLSPRSFTNYSGDNTEFIIITHASLSAGQNAAETYANYRRSTSGGGYNVNVYLIEDIYDQFGYGVNKHPQAIRNFNKMMSEHWSDAKMALIIGKGVSYTRSRTHGSQAEQRLLVPTFGQPGSDNLLFTENGVSVPKLAVGRLPVENQDQIQTYLNKVIEYELVSNAPQTLTDKAWTKNVLHLGGGADAGQQAQIRNMLDQMGSVVTNGPFGAQLTTFTKNSTNVTSQSNSERIIALLREGVSIVKFFGHSSANTLDFQVNNPRDWQNKGRYPIFSAMGCRSGDIHDNFISLSENFVFEPDAGTIAFVAGSGAQYLNTLGRWGRDWYGVYAAQYNTVTLGESLLSSLELLGQFGDLQSTLLIEQQTLNGDPALSFYQTPGPDYLWDDTSVRFSPEIVTVNDPQFTLSVDVINIGTNIRDTVVARVVQRVPDGSEKVVFNDAVVLDKFRNPLTFQLPVDRFTSGINTFFLTIDADNTTAELPTPGAEENNELTDASGRKGVDLFILDNRARATHPAEFSIVTDVNPELIASSTNAFIKGATFVMEIDTVPTFDSPLRQGEYFTRFGGVLRWKPQIQWIPGTVYYWRVSSDDGHEDHLWDTSSFLYNPGGQKGWNQSHYGQFLKNVLDGLDLNHENRIDFDTVYRNIWVQNKVDFDPSIDDDPVVFINNNLRRDFFTFYKHFDAHVYAVVIDSFSARFLRNNPGGLYGSVNTTAGQIFVFPYNTTQEQGRSDLMTFLTDVVEDGMYVILFSYQRPGYMDYGVESWEDDEQTQGRSIFSVIEQVAPGSQIRQLTQRGSVPYLIYYRKNYEVINESIANHVEETLSFDYNFVSRATAGTMQSVRIGPARQWHALEWDYILETFPAGDIARAELLAISPGQDTIKYTITNWSDTTLQFIDAKTHPYLMLRFYAEDVPNLTAPYVEHWRVLYEGMPDLFIDPSTGYEFEADILRPGQRMILTTGVQNIGTELEESCIVRFFITDEHNQTMEHIAEIPPLLTGESTTIHLSVEMMDGEGFGSVIVELNADRRVEEVTYLNNTGVLNFTLIPDRVRPVLDVTFDGRHLVDGDVVSSRPVIEARLYDENPYRLLDKREDFKVYLLYPGDFHYTPIDIQAPEMSFIPAEDAANNSATLVYRPTLAPGYYWMIIQGHDRASNPSGSAEYAISFEVRGERLLSRVDVDPRWFTDETRFTFTLTGDAPPSAISLSIFDAMGKIVREIGRDEIGRFVGTTEYVWDGTTASGDRLPGGVYFYRLTARDSSGNPYDLAGPGFRSSRDARAGKLVIVR